MVMINVFLEDKYIYFNFVFVLLFSLAKQIIKKTEGLHNFEEMHLIHIMFVTLSCFAQILFHKIPCIIYHSTYS